MSDKVHFSVGQLLCERLIKFNRVSKPYEEPLD